MTVFTSTQSMPHPGRLDDAIALSAKAAKLLERHGAVECRLLAALTAGEATGSLVMTAEFSDPEAHGAAADAMLADAELLQLMAEVRGPKSPVTILGQMMTSQVPLDRNGNGEHGGYVEVHVSRLTPGRLGDVLDSTRRAADFVEQHGATNAQLATTFLAGTMSNQIVFSYELPSLRVHGKVSEAWTSDPDGLALYDAFLGADPSSTEIFSGLYAAVPL